MRTVIVFFIYLCTIFHLEGFAQRKFSHLTLEDGLSQTYVISIVQDQNGFLWFATQDGLNRYDGYTFEIIRKESHPELSDNYIIKQVFNPYTNELYFGTINGDLFRLSTETGSLIKIDYSTLYKKLGYIRGFEIDEKYVWFVSLGDGLYKYDYKLDKVFRIENDANNVIEQARSITKTNNGKYWIGSEKGLLLFNSITEKFEHVIGLTSLPIFQNRTLVEVKHQNNGRNWVTTSKGLLYFDDEKVESIKEFNPSNSTKIDSRVNSIYIDKKSKLWIGTIDKGLFVWSDSTQTLENYKVELNNSTSISSNYIHDIFEDYSSVIWIGTSGAGISKTLNIKSKIEHYWKTNSSVELRNNMIRSFYEDEKGLIWLATGGGGLNTFNPSSKKFNENNIAQSNQIQSFIWDIVPDKKGNLFLGVRNGVQQVSLKTGKVSSLQFGDNSIIVPKIYLQNDSTLLTGSLGKGLFLYNLKSNKVEQFLSSALDSTSIPNNFVFTFLPYSNTKMWVGTFGGGLTLFDLETKKFSKAQTIFSSLEILDSKITSLQHHLSSLWIGTSNGLYHFQPDLNKVESFTLEDGLPNNYIYSIEIEQSNKIWVSTNKGLSRIDLTKNGRERFLNFSSQDGIQSLEFNTNSSIKSKDGKIYFGGVNGFNRIDPETIKSTQDNPHLAISKFAINNKDEQLYIANSTKEITLSPDDKIVSFNLSSLEFVNTKSNQFAYKLKGYDSDWVYIGNRNFIQFANLVPDTYELWVKGTNVEGYWGDAVKLAIIHVKPPFWLTWWFRLLIISIVFTVIARLVQRMNSSRIQLKKTVIETSEKLSRNEELFKMITDNIADTIVILNTDMSIEYVSSSSKQLLGYEPSFLYEIDPFTLIHTEDEPHVRRTALIGFSSDTDQIIEFRMKNANGLYKVISASTSRIKEGVKPQVIAVMRDITEIRVYENALIKSKQEAVEANKAKSMFLAGMSHELRTPLNAILGFAQILQHDEEIPKRKRDFIQTMYKSGNHLLRMINDVLDFSKIEAGKQQVKNVGFDLMSMAYEIESMFALECQRKSLIFDFEFGSSTPRYIKSDPAKLQQVLINLIGNAVKFTEIGMVSFHVKAHSFNGDNSCILQFVISDTGIGIPEENQENIFEPFHQVDHSGRQGTGLGLSISKKLIELLGGSILLKSVEEKGSTFEISLPVNYELIMDLESNDDVEKWHYEGLKILIVDDISTNREMAREMLQQYNMIVKVAENGTECMNLLKEFEFDVILMDYLMPEMNGDEVLKKIREQNDYDGIPIVALTAFGLNKSGSEFIEMGFDGYLSKPLSKKELLIEIARVAKLLSSSNMDPIQTLKDLSVQTVAASILDLDEDEKEQWMEHLEVLDLDMLVVVLANSSLSEEIKEEIQKEVNSLNYRYFISLNELIN